MLVSAAVLSCLAAAGLMTPVFGHHHDSAVIQEAPSAASPELIKSATVMAWKGRMPIPTHLRGTPPMCNDPVWIEWADAYLDTRDHAGGSLGVCYMFAGVEGANDVDPHFEARPTTAG